MLQSAVYGLNLRHLKEFRYSYAWEKPGERASTACLCRVYGGMICALNTKFRVAKVMLDSTHTALESQHPENKNTYTLGSIGMHNFAIAYLANCLWRHFRQHDAIHVPTLRFGLMMGIGDGIPSKQDDIKLGDIVVSNQGGRVVQVDLDKKMKDGFHRVGLPQCRKL